MIKPTVTVRQSGVSRKLSLSICPNSVAVSRSVRVGSSCRDFYEATELSVIVATAS